MLSKVLIIATCALGLAAGFAFRGTFPMATRVERDAQPPTANHLPRGDSHFVKVPTRTKGPVDHLLSRNAFETSVRKNGSSVWNLEGSNLDAEEIAPFLEGGDPESIVFFEEDAFQRIYPASAPEGEHNTRTLFIAHTQFVERTAREREERANDEAKKVTAGDRVRPLAQLPENAFEIVFFVPGQRDSGTILQPIAENWLSAIQGPDYSLSGIDANDPVQMKALLATILSLGHGGELLLRVANKGFILDEAGFDFAVYENAFRIAGTQKIFQEFGRLGVSEALEPDTFSWFECDPRNGIVLGCVGAVPTSEGGDQFDLAEVGQKRARYIWIKDLGINKNFLGRWPTEGVDVDALRLMHAYNDN